MSRITTIILTDRSGTSHRDPMALPFELLLPNMTRKDVIKAIEYAVTDYLHSKDSGNACDFLDGDFSYLDLAVYSIPKEIWEAHDLIPLWHPDDLDIQIDMDEYIVTGMHGFDKEG